MAISKEALKPGILIYYAETFDGGASPYLMTRMVKSVGKVFATLSPASNPEGRPERVALYSVLSRYHLTKRAALLALVEKLKNTIEDARKTIAKSQHGVLAVQSMLAKLEEPEVPSQSENKP